MNKFTVYCLFRPPYNHFHRLVDLFEDIDFVGNEVDWFHHWMDDRSIRISQNEISAKSQFIGDRWGIIKSLLVVKSWQDFVIY